MNAIVPGRAGFLAGKYTYTLQACTYNSAKLTFFHSVSRGSFWLPSNVNPLLQLHDKYMFRVQSHTLMPKNVTQSGFATMPWNIFSHIVKNTWLLPGSFPILQISTRYCGYTTHAISTCKEDTLLQKMQMRVAEPFMLEWNWWRKFVPSHLFGHRCTWAMITMKLLRQNPKISKISKLCHSFKFDDSFKSHFCICWWWWWWLLLLLSKVV